MGSPDTAERLSVAFRRYDEAFQHRGDSVQADHALLQARLDLALLLADEGELPTDVGVQLTRDASALLKSTAPLGR